MRPRVSIVLGATMACWAATAASRKQRWIGLVRYTAAPPAVPEHRRRHIGRRLGGMGRRQPDPASLVHGRERFLKPIPVPQPKRYRNLTLVFGNACNPRKRDETVWARQDSNLQPTDYESAALTS